MRITAIVLSVVLSVSLAAQQPNTFDASRAGVVIMTNGDNGGRLIAALREKISLASAWDMHDKPLPR